MIVMKAYKLVISSPEGDLFRDEAVMISVRGVEGDLAVMAGHIPFITAVKECDCVIELENGDIKTGHTDGGILNVAHDTVTLLSGSFEWK